MKTNLFIATACWGIILYHLLVNFEIIGHPYMVAMFITLSLVAVYNDKKNLQRLRGK